MEEKTLNVDNKNNRQNQEEKKKVILDLLKQWQQIRKDNTTLTIKTCEIRGRRGIDGINAQVTQMKDTFMENAKMYGKKVEAIAQEYIDNEENKKDVIQQYKKALEAIQKEYEDRVNFIIENREKFEKAEEESYNKEMDLREEKEQIKEQIKESPEYVEHIKLEEKCSNELEEMFHQQEVDLAIYEAKKKEYEELKKQNPLEKYNIEIEKERKRREKIQDVIEMCDNTLDKCEEERKRCIKMKVENKNNQLSDIQSQNVVQRIMGGVINKFDLINKFKSAKKVVNNLIDGVDQTTYYLNKEVFPVFRKNVSNVVNKTMEQINEKGTDLLQKGKRIGKETTEHFMEKAEKTLTNSIEKAKQVNEQRSLKYANLSVATKELER